MPGHTLDEILAVIDEEIAALQAQARRRGRARARQEPDRVGHRAQPRAPAGARRAAAVATTTCVGDPGFLAEDLRRYRAVDAAAIQRAAQQYLKKDAPRGRDRRSQSRRADHGTGEEMTAHAHRRQRALAAPALALSRRWRCATDAAAPAPPPRRDRPRRRRRAGAAAAPATPPRRRRPRPPPSRARRRPTRRSAQHAPAAPAPSRRSSRRGCKRFKLKNGLEVILVEFHDLPLVDFNLMIKTGGAANPPDRAGLADLTAQHARRGDEDAQRARDRRPGRVAGRDAVDRQHLGRVERQPVDADQEPGRRAGPLRRRRRATRPSTTRSSRASATTC